MRLVTVSKALIVGSDQKLLILKRSADSVRRPGTWDLPGGHVDPGEYMAEAAARETLEETGIVVDSQEIQMIYGLTEAIEDQSITWLFFLGHTVSSKIDLSNEHDDSRWVSIDEALELIDYERWVRCLKYARDNDLLSLAR